MRECLCTHGTYGWLPLRGKQASQEIYNKLNLWKTSPTGYRLAAVFPLLSLLLVGQPRPWSTYWEGTGCCHGWELSRRHRGTEGKPLPWSGMGAISPQRSHAEKTGQSLWEAAERKEGMAYFLIIHKALWLGRSVPSWPEQTEPFAGHCLVVLAHTVSQIK